MNFFQVGEGAVGVEFGPQIDVKMNRKVLHLGRSLEGQNWPEIEEIVPAYSSVTIYFNPLETSGLTILTRLQKLLSELPKDAGERSRLHEVPVAYGEEFGPDLERVAGLNQISAEEVIRIHTSTDFRVFMLGFMPGFPYCGIVPEKLRAPRLASPRTRVPAGSVGIAAAQTGIYPMESPGGWQLIGRTPLKLFDPQASGDSMFRFHAGDTIRFRSISPEEFYDKAH